MLVSDRIAKIKQIIETTKYLTKNHLFQGGLNYNEKQIEAKIILLFKKERVSIKMPTLVLPTMKKLG